MSDYNCSMEKIAVTLQLAPKTIPAVLAFVAALQRDNAYTGEEMIDAMTDALEQMQARGLSDAAALKVEQALVVLDDLAESGALFVDESDPRPSAALTDILRVQRARERAHGQ